MPLSVLEAFSSPCLTLSSCLHRRGAPDAAQDVVCLLGSEHTLLAHVQLFIQENSTGLLSMSSSPCLSSCLGLPQRRCSPLHLDLLSPISFSWAHFSSPCLSGWQPILLCHLQTCCVISSLLKFLLSVWDRSTPVLPSCTRH